MLKHPHLASNPEQQPIGESAFPEIVQKSRCGKSAGPTWSLPVHAGHGNHLVAVGTAFTGRPPRRSVQARLRTRLLRRMSGVEASLGIGMQDAGRWDPSVEDWRIFRPLLSRGLTAASQNVSP